MYDLNSKVNREDINNISHNFFKFSFFKRVIKKINRSTRFLNNNYLFNLNRNLHYKKRNIDNLINYVNNESFDIVVGAQGDMAMYLALIKDSISAKAIGWNHSMFDCYYYLKGKYYYGESYLFKKYLVKLDEVVVLSNYDKECFKSNWNMNVSVIPNIKSFSSSVKSSLTKKNFLAVGRFTHAKGFDILIEAFNIFKKNNNGYRLTIIGEGELEVLYYNLIKKYNLEDSVFILNGITNIKPYLLNSCALIMPSRWEGLGMVMVESFEMGVPVIAFDLPSIKDYLINNYNGLKCSENTKEDLARVMKNYKEINNLEMQKNVIKSVEIFNEDNVVEQWSLLFNKLHS